MSYFIADSNHAERLRSERAPFKRQVNEWAREFTRKFEREPNLEDLEAGLVKEVFARERNVRGHVVVYLFISSCILDILRVFSSFFLHFLRLLFLFGITYPAQERHQGS